MIKFIQIELTTQLNVLSNKTFNVLYYTVRKGENIILPIYNTRCN